VRAEAPDIVFHMAARSVVRHGFTDPLGTLAVNAMGTANVLEAVRQIAKPCRVVVVTSDKCYENKEWPWGYRETDALGGRDIYSASKASAEHITHAYVASFFGNNEDIKVVTETQPTEEQKKALLFSQRVVKYVKSNAIVVSNGIQAFGIGGGQVNRIWATQQAIERAKEKFSGELVLASDAFFPFRDVVDFCAQEGITAIIQPGGSVKDQDSIDAANEHNIPMMFTGIRHFLH
jgi:hypothetical protein